MWVVKFLGRFIKGNDACQAKRSTGGTNGLADGSAVIFGARDLNRCRKTSPAPKQRIRNISPIAPNPEYIPVIITVHKRGELTRRVSIR